MGGSQSVGGGGGESSLATSRAFPFDRVPMYGGSATEESGSIDLIRGLLERRLFVSRVDETEEKNGKPKINGKINERTRDAFAFCTKNDSWGGGTNGRWCQERTTIRTWQRITQWVSMCDRRGWSLVVQIGIYGITSWRRR
jgi:hypothetical protein